MAPGPNRWAESIEQARDTARRRYLDGSAGWTDPVADATMQDGQVGTNSGACVATGRIRDP
jgi:hypothetical protein